MSAAAQAPWYFRYRVFVIAAAYSLGFVVGQVLMPTSAPTYVQLAGLTPPWFGARGMLGLIVALTLAGALLRIWGASYLSSSVVHSWNVHTGALYVGGPYRFTRNPLYLGNLLWALAIGAYGTPLATVLVVLGNYAVVELLIRTEEEAMYARFGAQYAEYRSDVPRLIPLWFRAAAVGPALRPDWGQGLRSELFGLAFVGVAVAGYVAARPTFGLFGLAAALLILAGFLRGGARSQPA